MDQEARLYQALEACATRLDELNCTYPQLASDQSRDGVALWRERTAAGAATATEMPLEEPADEMRQTRELALSLLKNNGLEDVLEILLNGHRIDLSLDDLILLVGTSVYVEALKTDARKLVVNAISYQQIASLWNDLDRPALSGSKWNAKSVSSMLS
jgi:hypothetical protein